MSERRIYEVIVGNVGTVYSGEDYIVACRFYSAYKDQSKKGYGRAAGESVVMMAGEEIRFEHVGTAGALDVD